MAALPMEAASAASLESEPSCKVVRLLAEDGSTIGTVQGDYEDSFTLETMEYLFEQHSQENKAFILARVQTRDKHEISKTFYSYYCAHQLNKLLFKRRGREIVSRYSRSNPLLAVNPRTNSEIIGEVYYFKARLPEGIRPPLEASDAWGEEYTPSTSLPVVGGLGEMSTDIEYLSPDPNTPMLDSLSTDEEEIGGVAGKAEAVVQPEANETDLIMEFLGTDYNFAFSKELRDDFKVNALSESDAAFTEDVRGGLLNGGELQEQDILNMLTRLPFDDGLNQTIDVPYARAVVFGQVSVLYILTSFLIFSYAVQHIISADTVRDTKWFWSILPFLSFMTDRLTAYLYHVQESRIVVTLKIILWTFYVLSPVVMFHKEVESYVLSRDILDITFPVVFLLYSFGYYIFMSAKRRLV